MSSDNKVLPPAKAAGLPIRDIEKIADYIRTAFKPHGTSDMHGLITYLGGKVKISDPEYHQFDVHGTLEVRSDNDWTVYLPKHTGPLQDKFTLAHELGHFILHSLMGKKPLMASRVFRLNQVPDAAEVEADMFALALLMPKRLITSAIKKYGNSPVALSAVFGIHSSLVEIRLKTIVSARKAL